MKCTAQQLRDDCLAAQAADEMEGQDQQSMSTGKEEMNVPSAPPRCSEGDQAMYPVLTGGNIIVAGVELQVEEEQKEAAERQR